MAEMILSKGKTRKFVDVYINGENIRLLQTEQTQVRDGDEVFIVPAIAGGACP